MTKEQLSKVYDPGIVEDKWYKIWEENGYFHQEVDKDKEPFCIVIPPPNVTGQLHMGHALDETLQDILVRYKRLQGFNTLWLPGTDHAGIATQAKVEASIAEEGLNKYDLGREEFLKRVWAWKNQYGARITTQLRKLGASCDWSRERFTMDEGCSKAVREVFVKYYEKGLIYQDNYIVNWCPNCSTTISDIEVEHENQPGHFYHVRYPIKDSDDYIVIATTRPETMLGDTGIAVNPDDDRYKHLVGKTCILPLVGREIPIVADEYCDISFGTGAVKMTPGHDPNDFEVGLRHNLEQINIFNKDATINENGGPYAGMDRFACREQIVRDLEEQGFLLKIEDYEHSVGQCYRCGTIIEPMISKQWFVRMEPLAKAAIDVVKSGELRFVPSRFEKIYLGWMENIRDWCISRQLWWGHRIPVWYCRDCGETIVSTADPECCTKCGSRNIVQDEDVLDTWFSSALWPFSTLGWPDKTEDLEHFYPTSVLVTGRDIIFFWVARMIFSGMENMKERPFSDVFVHGLVLDAQGRKMSKSLGNGIDPLEIIEQFGADSLRFMLITGNTPGNDLRFNKERLENARNFANKIWNASRFVLMNLEDYDPDCKSFELTLADKWIISRFNNMVSEVSFNLDKYELGEAGRIIYEFLWNEYCDWYIELAKPRLYGDDNDESRRSAQYVLATILRETMVVLHPFIPFITEEIWQHLPHEGETIMLSRWPEADKELIDPECENKMALLMEVIKGIRYIRSEVNIAPSKKASVILNAESESVAEILNEGVNYINGLGNAECKIVVGQTDKPKQAAANVAKGVEIFIPLAGLIDLDKEIERLTKDYNAVEKELQESRVSSVMKNSLTRLRQKSWLRKKQN